MAETAQKPPDESGPELGTAFAVLARVRRAPSAAVSDVCSTRYRRREPESTLLYAIVAGHLETFLAEARAGDGRGLPRYVEQELRAYLRCGILANGFVRAECKDCGKEIAVAFSCKRAVEAQRRSSALLGLASSLALCSA